MVGGRVEVPELLEVLNTPRYLADKFFRVYSFSDGGVPESKSLLLYIPLLKEDISNLEELKNSQAVVTPDEIKEAYKRVTHILHDQEKARNLEAIRKRDQKISDAVDRLRRSH